MFPDQDTPHASPGTVPGYSFCLGVPCPWAPSVLCTSDTDRRRGSPPSPTWSGRALGQACRGLVFFPMVTTEEDPSETEGEAWLLRHRPLYGNQRACDFDGTPELADLGGGGKVLKWLSGQAQTSGRLLPQRMCTSVHARVCVHKDNCSLCFGEACFSSARHRSHS